MKHYDIAIVGSGMGGGTLAYALRNTGASILILERGGYLPQEPQNWEASAIFKENRYKPAELWHDINGGTTFKPGVHYFVGGNTKVFGAAFPRLRRQDFEALEHEGGTAPAWPISYDELEPFYCLAETLYKVHGQTGEDPTEPARSKPFPFPAVPHEPEIARLHQKLTDQGLHPFSYPMGIDLQTGGRCLRCATCDGFPCKVLAKSDADVCAVRPALDSGNVELWTHTNVRRLLTDDAGKNIAGLEIERDGEVQQVHADRYVLACGAVNSAALLLKSDNHHHPNGLANSSGMVGRNYMQHNNSAMMAVNPIRRNRTVFQKTMAVNDFYFGSDDFSYPMGNLQLLGKLQAGMLAAAQPFIPKPVLRGMANRSIDWWVMSEDLPTHDNRITVGSRGEIQVHWKPTNRVAHERLINASKKMMKRAGYPLVFVERMGVATNSHQCGTLRFGHDPQNSILNSYCQTHDHANLYVVDGSFFPSSSAMNPALTIAAQAFRVAEHLIRQIG